MMSVYETGKAAGIYTDERIIPLVVFYSAEDKAWGVMFKNMETLSAFGNTPELALQEFAIMLCGAIYADFAVDRLVNPSTL